MADNPFVDHVQLAVAPGAGDGTGVVDLVTGLEQAHVGADCLDHAGHIPAQDFGGATFRCDVLADLGVHWVDGNGFDFHQQVTGTGDGCRQLDVLQGVRVADGQAVVVGNGFHGR